MLLHSRSELEAEGPPSRKELFWAAAATPLLLFQIIIWSKRVIDGFRGQPLQLSIFFEIEALKSDPNWHFAVVVGIYIVCIAFAALLLWACTLQFQRWLFWRGRT